LAGADLFGGVSILQLSTRGGTLLDVPSPVLSMLHELATIVVLTLLSSRTGRRRGCFGNPFQRG